MRATNCTRSRTSTRAGRRSSHCCAKHLFEFPPEGGDWRSWLAAQNRCWRDLQGRSGTPPQADSAPEFLVGRKFGPASDIWSFGLTLFEIVTEATDPDPFEIDFELSEEETAAALKDSSA